MKHPNIPSMSGCWTWVFALSLRHCDSACTVVRTKFYVKRERKIKGSWTERYTHVHVTRNGSGHLPLALLLANTNASYFYQLS